MKKLDFKTVKNGNQFRSAPFWAWNGKMEPEEVRRQVRVMHDMHMGGFFMHSRAGLATEYLGEKWFDCINAAIDEAEKLGMHASLYDEDRWPSGAAGGIVTKDRRYRMRYLEEYDIASDIPGEAEDYTVLGIFALQMDSTGEAAAYRKAAADETLSGNWVLKKYVVRIAAASPAYNDATYLDTTSAEAVQAFIDSTYEKYYQECGNKFGNTVQYFFTDEPNYLDLASSERRPWNDKLPEIFRSESGMDLLEHLPEIFHHCGKRFSAIRYRYYRIMSRLFADTFMKMIGEWCAAHNIKFTGHLLREDNLSGQVLSIGSAMPGYEYMQAPGIDVLTAKWVVLNTAKQVASAAHQFGQKMILSELYGCTGWDFPLYGEKSWAEWQYALGINLRCQHLAWYTMRGEAKRDYPASINCQSPWHTIHAPLEDYFVRLGELLDSAAEKVPLLVLHPIETMWGYAAGYRKGGFDPEYDNKFLALVNDLLINQLPFDYGDESLLAKHGAVNKQTLQVGKAAYQAVLLPEVETLRISTIKLLEEFVNNGGQVNYIGKVPTFIDGIADTENRLAELYKKFRQLDENYAAALHEEYALYRVSTNSNILPCNLLLRAGVINAHADMLYTVNAGCDLRTSMDAPWVEERTMKADDLMFEYQAPAGRQVVKLDLFSGEIYPVKFEYKVNKYCWQADVPAQDSCCYIIAEADLLPPLAEKRDEAFSSTCTLHELPAKFSEKNLLVLDHATAYDDGKVVAENCYVLDIDNLLRKNHNILKRGSSRQQPWYRKCGNNKFPAALEFEFFCEELPAEDLYIIMESPELFTIKLNNQSVSNQSMSFWCDKALEEVLLSKSLLLKGKNTLRLEFDYTDDFAGLESLLIAGNFGVINQNTITALPPAYSGKSLTLQRMPFYSGNTEYTFEFELEKSTLCQLQLQEWQGAAISIRWDAASEKPFYVMPGQEYDQTYLEAGKHILTVTVYGHRRNTFGPFYCQKRSCWIGPYEFTVTELPEKEVVPLGLLEPPIIRCKN